jgi:hypothetical protein
MTSPQARSLKGPSRLAAGIVGSALGLSSYILAAVYTCGGLILGEGSRIQTFVSALIAGPALACLRLCDSAGHGTAGHLIGFAVYALTAVLWVLLWVRLALWVRTAVLR